MKLIPKVATQRHGKGTQGTVLAGVRRSVLYLAISAEANSRRVPLHLALCLCGKAVRSIRLAQ
jgi:hypothetical protein